jgi:hypothetical protein
MGKRQPSISSAGARRVKAELTIAGLGCVALALGHTTIGVRWVLPSLTNAQLPRTPLGPPSRTVGMLRFTWHVVTILVLGLGVLLLTIAWAPHANPKTLLLRWCAAALLVAATTACWNARHRPRSLLRPPVPLVLVLIAALCGAASA